MYQAVALSRRARVGVGSFVTAAFVFFVAVPALAVDPPFATTESASSVTATGATLNGKVNPSGAAVATCRFEYGTTTAYGAALPCTPASLGTPKFNVAVSADLDSLEAGITYHYRLAAASVNGATQGVDRTFTTTGAPACPNADRRLEQGIRAIQLPDCMALEQVSPSVKLNQQAVSPTISMNGERVRFLSQAPLVETPGNLSALVGDAYLADRDGQGWTSTPTSPPYPITKGWDESVYMARSFDPTLSRWLTLGSSAEQHATGVAQLFRAGISGSFAPLSPVLEPIGGGGSLTVNLARLNGVSADHTRAFFVMGEPTARYTATDPVLAGTGTDRNVYVASLDTSGQPTLALMARDKNGKNWGGNCGARLGGVSENGVVWRNQGAISVDGSKAYISARALQPEGGPCTEANKLRILLREETPSGVAISEPIVSECNRIGPDPLCSPADGDDLFQGASVDQTRVYFLTNRQLADSDLDGDGFPSACVGFLVGGCDLYLYDAEKPDGQQLTQVSAGEVAPGHPTVGDGAAVVGVVAISGDGSHVYFAATGVLAATANPQGKTASEFPADPKLYAWDTDGQTVRFVGPLAAGDAGALWAGSGTFLNAAYPVPVGGEDSFGREIGGEGGILFFQSSAQLTAADADGGFRDSYRYDAEATPPTLECVSCRPGGPDAEPFAVGERSSSVPYVVETAFAEMGRWASEDGQRVLVQTAESLSARDLNGARDDYLWSSGELSLIPGTTSTATTTGLGQQPPVLSHDGDQVAFTAYSPLLPGDGDTAPDVYVARTGGGFPFPTATDVCAGEACRAAPGMPQAESSAASESSPSKGNVKTEPTKGCPQGKRKVIKDGKARCVRKKSKKGCPQGKRKVTKDGKARCVRKKSKSKKAAAKPRANRDQGGLK